MSAREYAARTAERKAGWEYAGTRTLHGGLGLVAPAMASTWPEPDSAARAAQQVAARLGLDPAGFQVVATDDYGRTWLTATMDDDGRRSWPEPAGTVHP